MEFIQNVLLFAYYGNEFCGYPSLEGEGDCANFVSQCLVYGGGHEPLKGSEVCRGFCGFAEIGAKKLGVCLKEKGWKRTCGYLQKPPSNIKAGDVLVYHKGSCSASDAHAVYITKGGTNPKITCHSSEQLDVAYTYMGTSKPYYEWLHFNE